MGIEGLKAMGGFTKYSCHWLKKEKEESTDSKALVSWKVATKEKSTATEGAVTCNVGLCDCFLSFLFQREKTWK